MKLLLVLLCALGISTEAVACKCASLSVREKFKYATHVVWVRVVAIADTAQSEGFARAKPAPLPYTQSEQPVLQIVKNYKGKLPERITLAVDENECAGITHYVLGSEMILFLYQKEDGRLYVPHCSRGLPTPQELLNRRSRKEIRQLEKLAAQAVRV